MARSRTPYYDAIVAVMDSMLHEEGRTPVVLALPSHMAREVERELGMEHRTLTVLNGSLIKEK